ncbi:MAG: M13 family metallopeptidase [Chlorobi bacterium]|nr:M13 family metallopeptidase [Chlorobiota bacterium]
MKKSAYLFIATSLVIGLNACNEVSQKKNMTKAIDKENMDLSIKAGDDLFEYANGGWIKSHPIPAEYSQYGAFTVIYEDNQKQLKSLVEEVSAEKNTKRGSVSQKIRDFYNSGMDTLKIEELGINAISSRLEEIENLKTKAGIEKHIAIMHRRGSYPLFYFYAGADQRNSSTEIGNFYQGGLGLPDMDYYINESDRSEGIRKAYIEHLTKMFMLKGDSEEDAAKSAQVVMDIETRLAKVSKTRLEQRDPVANYNKMNLDDLKEKAPGFDWETYFNNLGLSNPGDMNVGQVDFIAGMADMFSKSSVEDLKTYLVWNLLDNSANYLSSDFVEQNFDFFGRTLSGKQEIQARWKRVLNTTSSGLGEAIGQLYVEKYFPAESKQRMVALVENLRKSFAQRISQLDWMSDETKAKAKAKLDAITVKVGYPDKWKDYSKLEINPDNYYINVSNAREFEFNRNIAKIGKPVDKTEWGMTPQTVNAYYNPTNNEIVFPAGILQPPFFNKDADDAVNYGSIGVVIGHEMTHGFDDMGRQYDKDGNLNDWWTTEDADRFKAKIAMLEQQYDNYKILDSLHVDGKLTMGENIADLGGLNISYNALMMSYNGNYPADIDGFNYTQRFFLGYASVWRQNIRDKELIRRLKEDVHSPGDARVNIPPFNMDVFLKAFNISENDRLFIPEEKRAFIW